MRLFDPRIYLLFKVSNRLTVFLSCCRFVFGTSSREGPFGLTRLNYLSNDNLSISKGTVHQLCSAHKDRQKLSSPTLIAEVWVSFGAWTRLQLVFYIFMAAGLYPGNLLTVLSTFLRTSMPVSFDL